MRITFDNLDGLGAVDYSRYILADGPLTLKIERMLNAPSRCSGMLAVGDTSLTVPVRRARVVVRSEGGTLLFTGYVATEPGAIYAGLGTTGPVYRTAFSAVSDEWLLDKQPATPGAVGLAVAGGQALETLTHRAVAGAGAGVLTTSGVTGGRTIGVFEPEPAASWSVNAGSVASSAYAAYRVLNSALTTQSVGAVTHTLRDGDGTLHLSGLKLAAVKELANDVTVSGELEATAYVTERFAGDGVTAAFQLAEVPLRAGGRPLLLTESFDQGVFDPRIWNVTDPGAYLGFGAHGMAMTGGNGFDGQTALTAIDAMELGGTLVVEAGNLRLDAGSDGVICGLYSGATSRANCFAGYNVRQSEGSTVVVPFVDGVEVGTALTVLVGHIYTLRIRLHCVELARVRQTYYARVDGVVEAFGGGLIAAPMSVVFELQDLGVSSNTPATILYDGVVASSPASCSFVAVNAVQLFGSMGYCRVVQTGSAWIRSISPSGVSGTRLVGIVGEGVDCLLNSTGLVTFFNGRVPVAGEIVTVTYRRGRRAVARLQDDASVAAEAAGGMPGTAAWLGKVVRPKARSSVDCESAALAILSLASSRAAALAGSYEVTSVDADDVWPGDVLALTTSRQTADGIVRRVTIVDRMSVPEALTYRIEFANDWAEGLGLTLSEAVAKDALLPQTALSAASVTTASVLANLQQLQVVSSTETALQVDSGTVAPVGGGFEVRRRDWNFGAQVDQDLVLRSPVRSFSIPREGQVERYYVRMFDGSTPPLYSRFSSAVFTNLPVV